MDDDEEQKCVFNSSHVRSRSSMEHLFFVQVLFFRAHRQWTFIRRLHLDPSKALEALGS